MWSYNAKISTHNFWWCSRALIASKLTFNFLHKLKNPLHNLNNRKALNFKQCLFNTKFWTMWKGLTFFGLFLWGTVHLAREKWRGFYNTVHGRTPNLGKWCGIVCSTMVYTWMTRTMKKCLEQGSKILEAFDKVWGPHHAMCLLVSHRTWLSPQCFLSICSPQKKPNW
jgi:hypothetical protein